MIRVVTTSLALLLASAPLARANDEAARLAGLNKAQFMAEYEVIFPEMLEIQTELFERFDPEMGKTAIKTNPMTDAERAAMACSWDKFDAQGQLDVLAKQVLIFEDLRSTMADNPKFDIVDAMMNPEMLEKMTGDLPDSTLTIMADCDVPNATAERMNRDPAFWQKMGLAAAERGYLE